MFVTIKKQTVKPFKGDDGEERPYFWYIGLKDDGFAINFGSIDGGHEIGSRKDFVIEEIERRDGKKGYREII